MSVDSHASARPDLGTPHLRPVGVRVGAWAGVAAVVLVAVAFCLAPTFRAGQLSVGAWGDQQVFVAALVEAQAAGRSAISDRGTVGPGYVATARLLARLTGLEPGASLILLARLSFLVLVLGVLMGARDRGRRFSWPVLVALSAAVLLTPWRTFSDVPWTHWQASALLLVAVVALRAGGAAPARAFALGGALWLLAQTRSFEFQALVAALLVAGAAFAVPWLVRRDGTAVRERLRHALPLLPWGAAGAGASWLLVGALTGYWRLFGQYAAAGAGGGLSLDLGSVPTKLVQLFVDPCYRTFCGTVGDYQPQGTTPETLEALWRQPLLLQLPFTVASMVVVLCSALLLLLRRRPLPFDAVVAVLAAGALVLGYTANPIAGGAHLKYGFVRDFTAPAALLLYAAGRSVVHVLKERAARRLALPPAPVLVAMAALAALAVVPGYRLPRLDPVLVEVSLAPASSCLAVREAGCSLDAVGRDAAGRTVDLRDRVVLNASCDGVLGAPFVTDGTLPAEVAEADAACRAQGRTALITYRAVELGVYQTPEGETPALFRTF